LIQVRYWFGVDFNYIRIDWFVQQIFCQNTHSDLSLTRHYILLNLRCRQYLLQCFHLKKVLPKVFFGCYFFSILCCTISVLMSFYFRFFVAISQNCWNPINPHNQFCFILKSYFLVLIDFISPFHFTLKQLLCFSLIFQFYFNYFKSMPKSSRIFCFFLHFRNINFNPFSLFKNS
jgi:hypothetical protein